MNAKFSIGPYVFEVGSDVPRFAHDPNAIGLQITRVDQGYGLPHQAGAFPVEPAIPIPAMHANVVYYGPHPCDICGCMIVRMAAQDGGHRLDLPDGPIYPNSVWHAHAHRTPPPQAPEVVFASTLAPSHARAIASAILSAATEAKQR